MKTAFNDPRPPYETLVLRCASCRTKITMDLDYYPHSLQGIRWCPVCGTKEEADLHIREVK